MKYIIIFLIQLYWLIIPENKRRKCIFKKSCSKFVYEETLNKGFISGIRAFRFRYSNCRAGFEVFINPMTNEKQMILSSKQIINKEEIADRFLI